MSWATENGFGLIIVSVVDNRGSIMLTVDEKWKGCRKFPETKMLFSQKSIKYDERVRGSDRMTDRELHIFHNSYSVCGFTVVLLLG